MSSLFDLIALLLALCAMLGWVNQRWLHLPSTIGLLGMSLAASLLLIAVDLAYPRELLHRELMESLQAIDFRATVLNGMLAFLLFAGALRLDISALRGRAVPVAAMATGGVLISTAVVGTCLWLVAGWIGAPLPFAWALTFGALVSPTDPVAVLGTLASVRLPRTLETDMKGESLFNDGVGVVVFSLTLAVAMGEQAGPWDVAMLFAQEALGGAALGFVTGFLAYRMTSRVDDHSFEVMLSLALATGTYALAQAIHVSGPIAVVIAGLLLGSHGAHYGMSARTRRYVFTFWEVLDYVMNAALFLLIGLEVLVVGFDAAHLPLAGAAILLALMGRLAAVGGAVLTLGRFVSYAPGTVPVLTWGGLRGGISIALALSLPNEPEKPALLTATYAVAIFSILVQGISLGPLAERVAAESEEEGNNPQDAR